MTKVVVVVVVVCVAAHSGKHITVSTLSRGRVACVCLNAAKQMVVK